MKKFWILAVMASLVVFSVGCSDDTDEESVVGRNASIDVEEQSDKIISNRPNIQPTFMALVRLENPSLIEAGKMGPDGHIILDETLAGKILLEQERVIADFQRIAPESRVIFRYRHVLNALAIVIPEGKYDELAGVMGVTEIRRTQEFRQPQATEKNINIGTNLNLLERNSVKHIGATDAHQYLRAVGSSGALIPLRGQGIKVGVIDTGIDYTHKMFGGAGTAEAYQQIDPALPTNAFPNKKVVGGYDFVGSDYGAGPLVKNSWIPVPDLNPIDEAGHGTHVAGTISGVGDYVVSYDGVAPDADLYALKVFGRRGSTSDAVVIASLEWSMDPDRDLDSKDRLDVVNLSLGGNFGQPYIMYTEAVQNAAKGGLIVVAAAGNSGDVDFIVGAPSTANDALSVAATIDSSYHNWRAQAIRLSGVGRNPIYAPRIEGNITKPIGLIDQLEGPLVYIGMAHQPLTDEQKEQLKGKVALIDRGEVTFYEKLSRAKDAGAIGAVVANNVTGQPIPMGGEPNQKVDIPGVMISLELGNQIKEFMLTDEVRVLFTADKLIEYPELIDTITGFSSKGPRSQDYIIKPEISAPGQGVISAAIGSGSRTAALNGTSMAAPHIAGVTALLRQLHPTLSATQIKALAMNGSRSISNAVGERYSVSQQGAGLVQVLNSARLPLVVETPSISLGQVQVVDQVVTPSGLTMTNLTDQPILVDLKNAMNGIKFDPVATKEIAGGETVTIPFNLTIAAPVTESVNQELDGFILVKYQGGHIPAGTIQVPVLAFATKMSKVDMLISSYDPTAKELKLTYKNDSQFDGDVLALNYIGHDDKKVRGEGDEYRSTSCDLQSAGYRVITKVDPESGQSYDVLQFGIKLHSAVSSWEHCEISVQIDREGDGVIEQELAGIQIGDLFNPMLGQGYLSVLLDAPKVRMIRAQFEAELSNMPTEMPAEDYLPAVVATGGMGLYDYSTVALIEAPVAAVAKAGNSTHIKVAILHDNPRAIESDDFLGDLDKFHKIDLVNQGFANMPELVTVKGNGQAEFTLSRVGDSPASLLIYTPQNELPNTDPQGHQFHLLKVE